MNRGVIALIAGIVCLVVLLLVAGAAALVFAVFGMMDRAPAHVCGLAIVQRSPAAMRLVGTPIAQKGFTGGSTSENNGESYQRLTFNVTGPRGDAFVLAEGTRSPLASHLRVTIGRNQHSEAIYSGPLDCPELHESQKR
ncbi:MAG TPA: cytochrome c oxidase assembly factor Coa1 family protein [Candidatus Baltobacteraceae bacterium]|nr:cytochrome c oxidase assembly factor Coa1 family protein [Candidatus Baltobacteraceae bacterium]